MHDQADRLWRIVNEVRRGQRQPAVAARPGILDSLFVQHLLEVAGNETAFKSKVARMPSLIRWAQAQTDEQIGYRLWLEREHLQPT